MSKTTANGTPTAWEKLGINLTPISAIPKILDIAFAMPKKLTTCFIGETGIGKTPSVAAWCKANGAYMRILNFGSMSPEDTSMGMFNEDATNYDFVPPRWLVELNERAEKQKVVMFFDEWNRGAKELINALFVLNDERRLHNFYLHDNVLLVAAMNPSDGSYIVNGAERDHAVRKRLNFVFVKEDLASWLVMAEEQGYDENILSFLRANPSLFYDYGARDSGKCFACPSNWEKVSNVCKTARKMNLPITDPALQALIDGQVGAMAADKFLLHAANNDTSIDPGEVLSRFADSGSSVHKKVMKMLNKGGGGNLRADVITNLNAGIALVLFGSKPDVGSIAVNLAHYLAALPSELLMSITAGDFNKACNSQPEGPQYLTKLSAALNAQPKYIEAVTKHLEMQDNLAAQRKRESSQVA